MSDVKEPPAPEFTGAEPSFKPASPAPLTPEAKAKIERLNEELRNAFDDWLSRNGLPPGPRDVPGPCGHGVPQGIRCPKCVPRP